MRIHQGLGDFRARVIADHLGSKRLPEDQGGESGAVLEMLLEDAICDSVLTVSFRIPIGAEVFAVG